MKEKFIIVRIDPDNNHEYLWCGLFGKKVWVVAKRSAALINTYDECKLIIKACMVEQQVLYFYQIEKVFV